METIILNVLDSNLIEQSQVAKLCGLPASQFSIPGKKDLFPSCYRIHGDDRVFYDVEDVRRYLIERVRDRYESKAGIVDLGALVKMVSENNEAWRNGFLSELYGLKADQFTGFDDVPFRIQFFRGRKAARSFMSRFRLKRSAVKEILREKEAVH